MNTGTRRFILRLIVGLLTFMIGVGAVMLLGGFTPFRGSSGSPYYRQSDHYYYYRSGTVTLGPAYEYPVYHKRGDGCRMRGELGKLPSPPPPAPHADAPMPPDSQWTTR
ncbi:MAG: hypothetical protein QOJ02_3636 [Acidobacteriota bacterium]|jgi:hypothetical protein|nr:hypothetical protein [Acidobacteriota bacterium]